MSQPKRKDFPITVIGDAGRAAAQRKCVARLLRRKVCDECGEPPDDCCCVAGVRDPIDPSDV